MTNLGCSRGGWLVGLVLAVLLVALLSSSLSFCDSGFGGGASYSQGVSQASSTVREKLPADAVTKTDWYTDADGDWVHNPSRLTSGLERFYDKTGVQPYVYILPNGTSTSVDELTARAEQRPWRPGSYDLKITRVEFLDDIKDSKIERFTITAQLDQLDTATAGDLAAMLQSRSGHVPLFFEVADATGGAHLLFEAKGHTLDVDKELTDYIKANPALGYKIN